MSTTTWNTPANLIRGVVVEAKDSSLIPDLDISECWERVVSLSQTLSNPSESTSVLCEIWPDTGRVIWILKDRREFCRVELLIPDLERRYFEISSAQNFDYDYDLLLKQIRKALSKGFEKVDPSFAQKIKVRDSDDATTEERMGGEKVTGVVSQE